MIVITPYPGVAIALNEVNAKAIDKVICFKYFMIYPFFSLKKVT